MNLKTVHGYDLPLVVSALQKAIRRGDARLAGYLGIEMVASGYAAYCWRRLLVISAEDSWGILTQEILALQASYTQVLKSGKQRDGAPTRGRIFVAKAILLLCAAKKCRDADHLTNFVYDRHMVDAQAALDALDASEVVEVLPEWTYDVHTRQGKRAGKTKDQFIREEFAALFPREPGVFDDLITED